jgi:hypothetical protein
MAHHHLTTVSQVVAHQQLPNATCPTPHPCLLDETRETANRQAQNQSSVKAKQCKSKAVQKQSSAKEEQCKSRAVQKQSNAEAKQCKSKAVQKQSSTKAKQYKSKTAQNRTIHTSRGPAYR